MLDLIDTGEPETSAFTSLDTKFLEPACGNGNFLVEILARKLRLVQYRDLREVKEFEFSCLRALASIYAIDICDENVQEARMRMLGVLTEYYNSRVSALCLEPRFLRSAIEILRTNVMRGDSISKGGTYLEIVEYRTWTRRRFKRLIHPFDEVSSGTRNAQSCVRQMPAIGYALLAENPARTGLRLAETV